MLAAKSIQKKIKQSKQIHDLLQPDHDGGIIPDSEKQKGKKLFDPKYNRDPSKIYNRQTHFDSIRNGFATQRCKSAADLK